MPAISLAIPLLNEEENVALLLQRVFALAGRKDFKLEEVIFVDDGSTDRTFDLLAEAAKKDDRIKVISLSRNFGHQVAVSAALDHAKGDAVVIIDGDLQDPPETVPLFVAKWREGFGIVYGVRKSRNDGVVKKSIAALFYRLLRKIANINIPIDSGDFSLLDKKVVNVLKRMPERSRYIRGLRAWSGFMSAGVEFERDRRRAGKSKYTLKRMIDLATSGIIGFSTVPLRIAAYIGVAMALLSIVGGLVVFVEWLIGDQSLVRGWAPIMLAFFFVSGVQLFILGIMGEHIGRVYIEVQARPLYIVREKVGFDSK